MSISSSPRKPALGAALGGAVLAACASIEGASYQWNPAERFYPPYVADPRRPRFGIAFVETDSELPRAGNRRIAIETGGRFDVVRYGVESDPHAGVLLDVEAGGVGDFDLEESQDNLAWSGLYGIHLSWLAAAGVALRVGFAHDSSHVGDEFLLEVGGGRLDYTREELLFGASWTPRPPWRLYGEYGYGTYLGDNSFQDAGRAQAGVEWASDDLRGGVPGWYAASDVSSFEERDWAANVALQAGWAVPTVRGTWRFGGLVYDGRSILGEISPHDETRLALGVWYDL
jgi:hypothetical protein